MKKKNSQIVEIINKRLFWLSQKKPPEDIKNAFYFCIDKDLLYKPFNSDFGPLDIHKICLFCNELKNLLKKDDFLTQKIIQYTSTNKKVRTNAALLMGSFMVLLKRFLF